LFVLRPGATAPDRVVPLDVQSPVSVAAGDEGVAFVAHRGGIARVDLRSRSASRVTLPQGVSLGRLERLRRHGSALIAVQLEDDGTRHVIRLDMSGRRSAVVNATRLDVPALASGDVFVTVSDDDLLFLIAGAQPAAGVPAVAAPPGQGAFAV